MTITAGLLLFTLACQQQVPDTRAADEKAIRDLEAEWSRVSAAKDVEGTVALYVEGASNFPANEPIETGLDAIRAGVKKLYAQPGYTSSSQLKKVELSRSGDLAVTHGTYTESWNDEKGKPVSDTGKWITVYRKQPDGKWKTIMNMYNSDLPVPSK